MKPRKVPIGNVEAEAWWAMNIRKFQAGDNDRAQSGCDRVTVKVEDGSRRWWEVEGGRWDSWS